MNISPTVDHPHVFVTTAGARHFVRRFMERRQDLREVGITIDKHHIVTWLGRDDGFAADLAYMAKHEHGEVILADPDSAITMPLSIVVFAPRVDVYTLDEIKRFRARRLDIVGRDDVIVHTVACIGDFRQLGESAVNWVEGPDLTVHCEWVVAN